MDQFNHPTDGQALVPVGSAPQVTKDDVIDFSEIYWAIRRHLKLIFAIIAVGVIASGVVAFTLDEKFTATAQILVNPPQQNLIDVEAFDQQALSTSYVDSQVELVRSRMVDEAVIEKLRLYNHPVLRNITRKLEELSPFSAAYWADLFGFSTVDKDADPKTMREKVSQKFLEDGKSIRRVGLTDVIDVRFRSTNPVLSANIANALVQSYLDRDRQSKLNSIDEASDWLTSQIDEMRLEVSEAERAVEQYRASNKLVDISGNSLTDQRRVEINRQLVIASADVAEAEARLQRVEAISRQGGDVQTIAEILASDTISDLRRQQAQLTRRRAELLARYGAKHPSVINITAELADIDIQIGSEANRIVTNLSNEVAVASSRVRALRAEQASLDEAAAVDEAARIELRELERSAAASRRLYENLLEGYKTSFVASNAESLSPSAALITPATAPNEASFPNKPLVVAIGFILSALAAGVAVLILEVADNKVQSLTELSEKCGLRPLVTLPKLAKKELDDTHVAAYIASNPLSSFSECIKRLRSTLEISRIDCPPRVIQVSSALPAEGKTTCSIALAASYGRSGEKTLLIDCDLRRPAVYSRLGLDKPEKNLLDVLTGEATLEQAVIKDPAGFDLLLNARVPIDSADILSSLKFSKLIDSVRNRYDRIILDSAPVLPIIDSVLLSKVADMIVMSVMFDQTPAPAAKQAVKILEDHGAYVLGGVLSSADAKKAAKYGSKYGYNEAKYYKKYGSYYTSS